MIRIEIVRGDSGNYKFRRITKSTKLPILIKADKIYFTVKRSSNDTRALFQKTIDDMQFDSMTGYYSFTINPEDTENLKFGDYVYDIEVIAGDSYKRTISPRPPENIFRVISEVTYKCNEV